MLVCASSAHVKAEVWALSSYHCLTEKKVFTLQMKKSVAC